MWRTGFAGECRFGFSYKKFLIHDHDHDRDRDRDPDRDRDRDPDPDHDHDRDPDPDHDISNPVFKTAAFIFDS